MYFPRLLGLYSVLAVFVFGSGGYAADRVEILPPGYRPAPPKTQALIGGKVVVKPGEVLNPGTIIIRDGVVVAVGTNLTAPAEAMIQSREGQTIYAGFIDPYLVTIGKVRPVTTTAIEPVNHGTSAFTAGGVRFFGVPGDEVDPGKSGAGHESSRITPQRRMAEEYSPNSELLEQMRELGFTTANIVPDSGILRGTSALVALSDNNPNEAMIKPEVFQHAVFDTTTSADKGYPRSLMGVIAALRQSFMDGDYYQRAQAHYQQHPTSGRRPPFNPAWAALAPVLQQKLPVVIEPGSALMTDRAARLAREFNLSFYLVSSGQEWRRPEFIRAAGTSFIVPINFPELPKLPDESDWHQVSLDQLRAWDWAPENPALLKRQGVDIALTTFGLVEKKIFRKKLRLACDRGLSETDALAALTVVPARLCGLADRLGTIEPGKLANFTVVRGDSYFDPKSKVTEVWIEGHLFPVKGSVKKTAPPKAPEAKTTEATPPDKEDKTPTTLKLDDTSRALRSQRIARGPWENRGPSDAPGAVLIRGATLWTCGPAGVVRQGDLLVVDGTIRSLSTNLHLPENFAGDAVVIDGHGLHLTPGLIDAHNHSMILGGVNEGTVPSSAMVRIGDVVNSETANISRQLAGGLTIANLLHGSANPIGGQNSIIKLRDGLAPEDLKLTNAPLGIKFALGENVKQSSREPDAATRFPQTRMGVKTFFANRFGAARQYVARQKEAADPPLRRDLELEALAEILRGERWIHCHSYRQDEILAFLRTMEQFGVKVGTLQHVLEGYKVADEIARHGAGASCFSDWWGYKFEVYDAIPYAGSLMRERGVLVSFNSDSSDLARRLNLEAAKAIKYGGTPEDAALHFVTINPARQLRIEQRVGSLEPGKDADFAIWSGSPLDSGSVCLQTWIDGRKYFDRARALEQANDLVRERVALREKARKILQQPDAANTAEATEASGFFQLSLEHEFDHIERHCLDDE